MMRTRVLSPVAAGWVVTGLATLGYAANSMNQQVIFLLGEQIKRDLRLTDTQLGLLFGLSYMAFSALSALPLGYVADRVRRRLVVGLSLALMGVASALTSLVTSFGALLALRVAAGTGDGGIVPAASTMIGASVKAERRPLSLSIFNAGSAVGAFLCYRYGSAIAEAYGWRATYLAVGLLGIGVALVIASLTPDHKIARVEGREDDHPFNETLRSLMRLPAYRQIVFAFVVTGFVSAASWSWIALVLQRGYGLSVLDAGAFLGFAFGVATVSGSLAYGLIAARLRHFHRSGPILAAIAMQIASAISFMAALACRSPEAAKVLLFFSLFFAGSGMVVVFDALQQILPDRVRATGVGLAMLLFSMIGQGLGPLFTGSVSDMLLATNGAQSLVVVVRWVMGIGSIWICIHLALAARRVAQGTSQEQPAPT